MKYAIPVTQRFDGALVIAGVEVFAVRPLDVKAFLSTGDIRGRSLLGRIIVLAAPLGAESAIHNGLERFGQGLETLTNWCLAQEDSRPSDMFENILVWDVGSVLAIHLGGTPALQRIHTQALQLAERLVQLEPDNPQYLRDLSISYDRMGEMDFRIDPALATEWYDKGLKIIERLIELEPENPQYERELAVFKGRKIAGILRGAIFRFIQPYKRIWRSIQSWWR